MDIKKLILKISVITIFGIHNIAAFCAADTTLVSGVGFSSTRIPLVAITHNQGDSWELVNPTLNSNDIVTRSSCANDSSACILNTKKPMQYGPVSSLRISPDNGQTWQEKTLPGIPSNLFILDTDIAQCLKSNCIVAQSYSSQTGTSGSVLLNSKDLGNTWQPLNVINPPTDFTQAHAVYLKCSTDNATCVIKGNTPSSQFILNSLDQGNTWTYSVLSNINNISENENLTSCTGTTCIIMNEPWGGRGTAHISEDAGKTWRISTFQEERPYCHFASQQLSCTGHGKNTICASAGYCYFDNMGKELTPALFVSKDGGNSWTQQPLAKAGKLTSVSCTGEGNAATCVAVGNHKHLDADGMATETPLIYTSNDGGSSWLLKSIPDFTQGIPSRTQCKNTMCTIEGYKMENGNTLPFLAVSNDQGNTWKQKTIQAMPTLSWGALGDLSK